jgi:hypothetical protein
VKNGIRLLKVKIKSLAAEARIIRREEKQSTGRLRWELWQHRVEVVRREARLSQIAYGFLRGKRYDQIEKKVGPELPDGRIGGGGPLTAADWVKIESMVERFGARKYWDRWYGYSTAGRPKETETECGNEIAAQQQAFQTWMAEAQTPKESKCVKVGE